MQYNWIKSNLKEPLLKKKIPTFGQSKTARRWDLLEREDPGRSYPWWGQTHSWPRIGVRRIRISFSVAPRLHLSRLPRARSRSLFFPLHHGPTRRKGWFVDLTSGTVGASLTYRRGHRTLEVDVPMQQTNSLIADVDWLATSYDRSALIHHESRARGGKKEPLERWFSFFYLHRFDLIMLSHVPIIAFVE